MANKLNGYLKSAASGFVSGATNPKGLCANWQHATRLFVDDTYRLSPRTKFLFYVYFDINTNALKSGNWDPQTHGQELGMLVKRADLPKFNIDTVTQHQYNRKKIVHKTLNYQPVTIALHDDSNAIVSSIWALYYGYYVRDRHHDQNTYKYNQYAQSFDKRFGLDNDLAEDRPFFNSIQVFTMSRRRFIGYTMVNPRITDWTHGNGDYFEGDTIESSMTIEYENVVYSSGEVTYNNPKGFANLHYDTLPSPLTVQGGGVENLLGEGGVLDGASQIFGDIASGAAFESPQGLISTAIKAANTVKNAQNLSLDNIKKEALGALAPVAISAAGSAISALGAVFPKSSPQETIAIPKSTPAAARDLAAAESSLIASQSSVAAARDLATLEATIPNTSTINTIYPKA